MSILPFDTIGLVMDSKTVNQLKILRVVRLFRLFKLFRIFRASRIFSRWESHISISYSWLSLTKFMVSVAAVSHWVRGCVVWRRKQGGAVTLTRGPRLHPRSWRAFGG